MTLVMTKPATRTNPMTTNFRTTRVRLDRQGAMNLLWRHYIAEERPGACNPETLLPSVMTRAGFKSPIALLAAEGSLTPTGLRRFGLTRNSMATSGYGAGTITELYTAGLLPKFLGVDVISDNDYGFLLSLQDAHDEAIGIEEDAGPEFIATMQTYLKNIGTAMNLTVPASKPKSMTTPKVKSIKPKAATKTKAVKAKSTKRKGAK